MLGGLGDEAVVANHAAAARDFFTRVGWTAPDEDPAAATGA
jgi:hypothetical protein